MVESLVSYMLTTYMSPYFTNFSRDKLKLSFFQGEVTLRQLFFNDKILDSVSLPLKLKFGNLESLKITIPSYMKFASSGLKIKIKNVFLCFEMLDVQKWSEENVINSYLNAKKARLKTYERNTNSFYEHLHQFDKKDAGSLEQILANLTVEIENTYIRFEDSNLKFDIGILIPRIEMQSTDKKWDFMEKVVDLAVLYKSIAVSKVDAYINYGDTFRPLSQFLDLDAFSKITTLPQQKQQQLEDELHAFIKRTFEDSAVRFTSIGGLVGNLNKQILRDQPFSLDTRLQFTMDKKKAMKDNPDFKEPDVLLDMIFGGLFKNSHRSRPESAATRIMQKTDESVHFNLHNLRDLRTPALNLSHPEDAQDESLSLLLDEQQLKAALHFMTLMACYSDFSNGVIQSQFYSKNCKQLSASRMFEYLERYRAYREAKFMNHKHQNQILQDLAQEFEADLRTDIILLLRDAETERFYGAKTIKERTEQLINPSRDQHAKSFWDFSGGSTPVVQVSQIEIERRREEEKRDLELNEHLYQARLHNIRTLLNQQFSRKPDDDGTGVKSDTEKMVTSTSTQITFRMPKLELELFAMDQESFSESSKNDVPDFACDQNQQQKSIAFLALTGLVIDFKHQTQPVNSLLSVDLKSLSLKDKQIIQQVKQLNKHMPKDKVIYDSVIETRFQNEVADTSRPGKTRDSIDLGDSKLMSLKVIINQDEYTQLSSSVSGDKIEMSNGSMKKDMKYDVDLKILGTIIIFSNFAFVKRLMYLAGRVSCDIREKRLFLIRSINQGQEMSAAERVASFKIKEHIINGFAFVSRLKDYAQKQITKLKLKRMHQADVTSLLRLNILAFSPKLVIDEYLWGDPLFEKKRPVYFLLDMGKLKIENSQYKQNIEHLQGPAEQREGFYESFDMKFVDLKMIHSHVDVESLLEASNKDSQDSKADKNTFQVFEKFDFGIQFQKLVLDDEHKQLPETIVNLKLKQVRLHFDRVILNQLFKIQAFIFEGSYNMAEKFMKKQMGKMEYEFKKLRVKQQFAKAFSVSTVKLHNLEESKTDLKADKIEEEGLSEMVFDERPNEKKSDSLPIQQDFETFRCNVFFSGMKLTKYKIEWPEPLVAMNTIDLTAALSAKGLAESSSERVAKPQFSIEAQQLKIARIESNSNGYEVYCFLKKIDITDLEHENYHFKNVIEQSKLVASEFTRYRPKHNSTSHEHKGSVMLVKPIVAKKMSHQLLPQHIHLSKRPSSQQQDDATVMNETIQADSVSQQNQTQIKPDLHQSFRQYFMKKTENKLEETEILKFEEFASFAPRAEYEANVHQVSVLFKNEQKKQATSDKSHSSSSDSSARGKVDKMLLDITNKTDQSELVEEHSEMIYKIKKIKLVALLALIEQLVQDQYDILDDYNNAEPKYKEHVTRYLKKLAKGANQPVDVLNSLKTQVITEEQKETESDESMLILLDDSHSSRRKRTVRLLQTSSIVVHMPEFQVMVPTNLLDRKSLLLKIDSGYVQERQVKMISDLITIYDDQDQPLTTRTKLLERIVSSKMTLTRLQMYLKYWLDPKVSKKAGHKRNVGDHTFKNSNEAFMKVPPILIDYDSDYKKPILTKSQVVFPFDFVYCSESITYTKDKLILDDLKVQTARAGTPAQNFSFQDSLHEMQKRAVGSVGKNKSDIWLKSNFKLQLRLAEVAKYQQLIQLLLFYNNRIMGLKPTEYITQPQKSRQNSENSLRGSKTFTRQASAPNVMEANRSSTFASRDHHVIRIEEESADFGSIFTDNEPESNREIVTIDALIAQHTQVDSLSIMSRLMTRFKQSDHRDIWFSQSKFTIQQEFQVCLVDDLTQSYEESLLAFVVQTYTFESYSIDSNTTSPFKAERQFEQNKLRLEEQFDINLDCLYQFQFTKVRLFVSNFNHKSLVQEYLIEPISLEYLVKQATPQSLRKSKVRSNDMFNVNVTYGCLLSLSKALKDIKANQESHLNELLHPSHKTTGPIKQQMLLPDVPEAKEESEIDHPNELIDSSPQGRISSEAFRPKSPQISQLVKAQTPSKTGRSILQAVLAKESVDFNTKKLAELKAYGDLLKHQFEQSEQYRTVETHLHQLENHRRKQLLPKFSFLNDLGKDIKFLISNDMKKKTKNDEMWETIQAGEYISDKEAEHLNSMIFELLRSYATDELKRAQLYISIQIDGYEELRDFPMFQLGLFSFKLTPKKSIEESKQKLTSQYIVVQLVHNKRKVRISFESNSVVYNNTNEKITLVAFDPSGLPPVIGEDQKFDITADIYDCDPQQVICLPFTWFEKKYQVQVNFTSVDIDRDRNHDRKVKGFKIDRDHWMFKSSHIRKVLNPEITDPFENHTRQLQTDKGIWIGLEFALLDTRTNNGQFVITLDYLCSIQSLMLSHLEIKPLAAGRYLERKLSLRGLKLGKARKKTEVKLSTISQNSAELQSSYLANLKYSFEPGQLQQVPEMNFDSDKWDIEITLETDENRKYSAIIKSTDLFNKSSKLMQFTTGTIVKLHRVVDSPSVVKSSNSIYLAQSFSNNDQETINIVLEKTDGQGCLKDTDYNNFSLRRKIYHQKVCKVFQFFAPLIAVNLTKHPLTVIQNIEQKTAVKQTLKPHSNLYVNLDLNSYARLNIQVSDYTVSNKISLQAGQNFIKMEKEQQAGQSKASKLELACSISNMEQPYNKTRVIRIVQRYVILNKLNIPIVMNQWGSAEEIQLNPQASMDLNFATDNDQSLIRVRLQSRHDIQRDGEQHFLVVNSQIAVHPDDHWSYIFSTKDIEDFQILLPKFEDMQNLGDKRPWYNSQDFIARVTVTYDQTDVGKLFIIISTPRSPDFLMINYLDFPLVFREKDDKKQKYHKTDNNRTFFIKAARSGLPIQPSAVPFVLNPNSDSNILEFSEADAQKKTAKVQHGAHAFNIRQETEKPVKFKRLENRLNDSVLRITVDVEMRVRESGNMRIMEIYSKAIKDKVKQDIQSRSRTDQKKDLCKLIQESSLGKNEQNLQLQQDKMTVKLQGIGFSIVDFEPKELCYVSFEGFVLEKEVCLFKKGTFQKTFSDFELSFRNVQIDANESQIYPILFGPLEPFRNIERQFRKKHHLPTLDQEQQPKKPYLKVKVQQTQENDGEIETKAIQKLNISVADSAVQVHLNFISQVQNMIYSFQTLLQEQDIFWQSEIYTNNQIIMDLFFVTYKGTNFSQVPSETLVHFKKPVNLMPSGDSRLSPKAQASHAQQLDNLTPLNHQTDDQRANTQLLSYKKMFAEKIHFKPFTVVMTLRLRGIEQVLQKKGPLGFLLNLSSNFADLSNAEFAFDELKLEQVHESQETLYANLFSHYRETVMQQLYQLLGSQDILGNPSSFIANMGRGALDLKNAPFDMLLEDDPKKAGLGVYIALKGLLTNTALAVSASYSGISGSLYLGLKNISGAQLTHENLDQPLSIGGGFEKGIVGFADEIKLGIIGPYVVPRDIMRRQGRGVPQLAKGIGQGTLQLMMCPINSTLRLTYGISAGVRNQVQGKRFKQQRFRHPRYFDQNQRMGQYDHLMALAQTSLRVVNHGKYSKEVINFAIDFSSIEKGRLIERVLMITNLSIMFIKELKYMKNRVHLNSVRGLMVYFYDKTQDSINLELDTGTIVKIKTGDPVKNDRFIIELNSILKQLSNQEREKVGIRSLHEKPHRQESQIDMRPKLQSESGSEKSYEKWDESENSIESESSSSSGAEEQLVPLKNRQDPNEQPDDGIPPSLKSDQEYGSDYTWEYYSEEEK